MSTTSTRSAAAATPPLPSVHVRAAVTWLAIFPLVCVGMILLAPFSGSWPLVGRALVLTLIVVPLAVYVVVPRLLGIVSTLLRRSNARRAGQSGQEVGPAAAPQ